MRSFPMGDPTGGPLRLVTDAKRYFLNLPRLFTSTKHGGSDKPLNYDVAFVVHVVVGIVTAVIYIEYGGFLRSIA